MSDTDSGIATHQQRKSGIRNGVTLSLPGPGAGAGWQRLRGCKGRPCPESRGGAFWGGCRVAAPAGCAEGSALAGNPKGSARGPGAGWQRLRGCKGRPCPESRGGAPWPSEVSKAQRPEGFDTLYWVLPVENGWLSGNATCRKSHDYHTNTKRR